MSKEQLDRMEKTLSDLVRIVGKVLEEQSSTRDDIKSIKEEQSSMRDDISSIKEEQSAMRDDINSIKEEQSSNKKELKTMKEENAARHKEVMDQLFAVKADNDLLWEKTSKNEREIGKIKKLQELNIY